MIAAVLFPLIALWFIAVGLAAATMLAVQLTGDPRDVVSWCVLAAARQGVTLFGLAAGIHRLQVARWVPAEEAVARERLRIDSELRQTLGAALEVIVARGQRAAARVGSDDAGAEAELRALIEDSRATLATVRSMVRSYQQVSPRAKRDTAVALLGAAGIEARLSLPRGGLPDAIQEAALRTALVRLLHDDRPARTCQIVMSCEDDRTLMELRTGRGSPSTSDFKIGPAYLMRDEASTPAGLDGVWRYDLRPMLEEQHYGRLGRSRVHERFGLAAVRARAFPGSAGDIGNNAERGLQLVSPAPADASPSGRYTRYEFHRA